MEKEQLSSALKTIATRAIAHVAYDCKENNMRGTIAFTVKNGWARVVVTELKQK